MSERLLRKGAAHWPHCQWWFRNLACNCGLQEAIDEKPDAVLLLEWCRDVTPWHPWHGELARHIERTLHICLTDKGWEWTADA